MRIFALMFGVVSPFSGKVYILTQEYELSTIGMFQRGSFKESFKFIIRESIAGLEKGTRHTVTHE